MVENVKVKGCRASYRAENQKCCKATNQTVHLSPSGHIFPNMELLSLALDEL